MAVLLGRVTLADVDGVASDSSVNDFCFNGGAIVPGDVVTNLTNFYNATYASGSVAALLGRSRSRAAGACMIQVYDITGHLDGSPHGSPVSTVPMSLLVAAASPDDFPRQAAITVALHALDMTTALEHGPTAAIPTAESAQDAGAPATHNAKTRPRAGLRGRIFLGPLNQSASDSNGLVLNPGVPNTIIGACKALQVAMPSWCIWSRRQALTTPIRGGWIDVEFTVIRRRKVKTVTRVAFTAP